MKSMTLALLAAACVPCFAQQSLTLTADSEPVDPLWQAPATLAYTRNGDHTTTSVIDAYLNYKLTEKAKPGVAGARQDEWAVAGYLHRSDDGPTPRNDRGVALTYSRSLAPDFANSGMPMSFAINAKVSAGKSLQEVSDAAGVKAFPDRNKDRESVFLSGYLQPAKAGPVPAAALRSPFENFFTWRAGLYSDHSSGGNDLGTGRLSGSMVALSWNVFPLGFVAADNRIGGFGVTPVITLSAQRQHDSWSSGARGKNTYKLYAATLTLEFATLVKSTELGRLKPSLNLSRSMGADLLQGRAREGKTELSLGLTF